MEQANEEFKASYKFTKSIIDSNAQIISTLDHSRLKQHFHKLSWIYTQLYNWVDKGQTVTRHPISSIHIVRLLTEIQVAFKPGIAIKRSVRQKAIENLTRVDTNWDYVVQILEVTKPDIDFEKLDLVLPSPTQTPSGSGSQSDLQDIGSESINRSDAATNTETQSVEQREVIDSEGNNRPTGAELGDKIADSAYETNLVDESFSSTLDTTVVETEGSRQHQQTLMMSIEQANQGGGSASMDQRPVIFKKPSVFDGENKNAREWLNEFRLCATANGWDEVKQIRLLPVYLSDDAAAWFDMDVNGNPSMTTMRAIQEAFIKQFSGTTEVADIEYRIDTARQKENEKPIKFILRMRSLFKALQRATGNETPEKIIVDKIKTRLLPEYTTAVFSHDPKTVDELHNLLSRLYEAQRRRKGKIPITAITQPDCIAEKLDKVKLSGANQEKSKAKVNRQRIQVIERREDTSRPNKNWSSNYHPKQARSYGYNDRRRNVNQTQRQATKDDECHYCHKKGHFARDCYTKKRDMTQKTQQNRGPNKRTNFPQRANASPAPVKATQPAVRKVFHNNTNAILSSILKDQLIYRIIKINGQPIEALIDTGAACSVISSSSIEALEIGKIKRKTFADLFAANGSAVNVQGSAEVELSIRIGQEEKITKCEMLVVKDLATALIIGSDICSLFQIGVFCPNELVFRDSPKVTLNAVIQQQYDEGQVKKQGEGMKCKELTRLRGAVRLLDQATIPAHAKVCVPASVENVSGAFEVIVTPFNNGDHSILVGRTICKPVDGKAMIISSILLQKVLNWVELLEWQHGSSLKMCKQDQG